MSKVEYKLATEEQVELAQLAYDITAKYLTEDRIAEIEAADGGSGYYPMDVHKALAEAGFSAMKVPEEYGGLGLDFTTQAMIVEEMSKVDAGFAFSYYASCLYFDMISKTSMPEEEKQKWAAKICEGAMGTFAITEPGAGSDAAGMKTKAEYDPATDEWVINGTKCFISGLPNADYITMAAWTDKTKRPSEGITFFFVEKERGWKIGRKEHKIGFHLSETCDLIFEDVRVPADHVIGEVGHGFRACISFLTDEGRITDAAGALGLAQAALDYAVSYAKERRQFGKRIADFQGLGFLLSQMQVRTDASRSLLYYVTKMIDEGKPVGHLSSSVKAFICESALQTCNDAVQVLGGYGLMKDYPVERYLRNCRIFPIFGGTTQILYKDILKNLVGKDPELARK